MSTLRERLDAMGIHPKRSLGQNFLHDKNALQTIVDVVAAGRPEAIVEIGPGPGGLTERLAEVGVPLVAIEKDSRFARLLSSIFEGAPHVRIIEQDFLGTRLSEFVPTSARTAVVGNIPYNLSTPILLHLLRQREVARHVTLMLQAELADRLRAPVGSRISGSLTVLVALLGEVRRVLKLPGGAFFPPPKVESQVLSIKWRAAPAIPVQDLEAFERIVRIGFSMRRKTLRNALCSQLPKDDVEWSAAQVGIDLSRRAETLLLHEWASLVNELAERVAVR